MKRISGCAIFLYLGLICLVSCPAAGDSGLITDDYKNISVKIGRITEDGEKLGLSRDLILSKVRSQLSTNGLTVVDKERLENLTVTVIVKSKAFSIEIAYERLFDYYSGGKTYYVDAKAWQAGSTGTHGESAAYVLEVLEKKLDLFITQYIKDNELTITASE